MSQACTERTLPSGERVRCHPPCDTFPEGREVLIHGQGTLRARLNATQSDSCAAHDELKQRRRDRLRKAQASLAAGEAVPHEKRMI